MMAYTLRSLLYSLEGEEDNDPDIKIAKMLDLAKEQIKNPELAKKSLEKFKKSLNKKHVPTQPNIRNK